MSVVNFERIRKALDYLQEGLAPFVEREINKAGISKENILNKLNLVGEIPRGELKNLSDKPINEWDTHALLKTILNMWKEVFSKKLKTADRNLIRINREIRNTWHHSAPPYRDFSSDYTDRAFNKIGRLLKAISADEQFEEMERLKTEKIIGIDLGTTNSCVATMKGDTCQVLEDREGGHGSIIPSVVAFPKKEGDMLVGEATKFDKQKDPQNTIDVIKRLIGRRFDDEEIQLHNKNVGYSIIRADNGDARVEIHGEVKSPEEISAYILHKMKRIARQHLGEQVSAAVITVPAYFNNAQRQATKIAGRIAGLDVKHIIHEPTAAALNYAYEMDKMDKFQEGSKIAVYDFGGGTFDISIVEMTKIDDKPHIDVKSINGDTLLGGVDFDNCIIEHIYSYAKEKEGEDLRNNKDQNAYLSEIRIEVEKGKKHLSSVEQTSIIIRPPVHEAKVFRMELTRSTLESLVKHLIDRTIEPCRIAMKDAGVSASDIDEVILVGGQTRMPKVQEVVESIFGKRPRWGVSPDKAVALGAARLIDGDGSAGLTEGTSQGVTHQDVTPHSLGIRMKSGRMRKLINKGTKIPAKESSDFTTAEDNQSAVTVHVLEGECEWSRDNKSLGHFHLQGIPPAPHGKPQIEVSFNIDANGILNVSAKDKATGNKRSIRITDQSGLSEEEIERLRKKMIDMYGF